MSICVHLWFHLYHALMRHGVRILILSIMLGLVSVIVLAGVTYVLRPVAWTSHGLIVESGRWEGRVVAGSDRSVRAQSRTIDEILNLGEILGEQNWNPAIDPPGGGVAMSELADWTVLHSDEHGGRLLVRHRVGWPFRAFESYQVYEQPGESFNVRREGLNVVTYLDYRGSQPWPAALDRAVPRTPIWPGLLADWAIASGAWLVLFALVYGTRGLMRERAARRRRARGRCPDCGYDLKGAFDDGCSECGWGRADWTVARGGTLVPSVIDDEGSNSGAEWSMR